MQQKKNIRLVIIWIILLSITIAIGLLRPESNKIDFDKDRFALKEKVNSITKVTIKNSLREIILSKEGRKWSLNEAYTPDPSKTNDLLGILSEISVRRKAAINVQDYINADSTLRKKVMLYFEDQEPKSFFVSENESGSLTYFTDDLSYVVNIPGYNYHVADIFSLDLSDWRTPYVFASNWTTLDKMEISYPSNPNANFEIVYDKQGYNIPEVNQLDSGAMYEYMEQISFLQVQSYLPTIDSISRLSDLKVIVKDVGDQQMELNFYIYPTNTLGLINNQEWAIFNDRQITSLLKDIEDFSTK